MKRITFATIPIGASFRFGRYDTASFIRIPDEWRAHECPTCKQAVNNAKWAGNGFPVHVCPTTTVYPEPEPVKEIEQ